MTWWQVILILLAGGLWTVLCVLLGAAIGSTAQAQKQRQSVFEEIVNRQDWPK